MSAEMPREGEEASTAEPGHPIQRQKHRSVAGGIGCEPESLDEPSNVDTGPVDRSSAESSQGSDEASTAVNSNAATNLLILAPA
jgi:hypothetical protein